MSVGSDVGGPGAAIASSATLGNIGEGSTKGKTLFKNNEDYTALRAAYTTNGVTFTDLGIISGTDPANQTDVNNPASQAQPATANKVSRWVHRTIPSFATSAPAAPSS